MTREELRLQMMGALRTMRFSTTVEARLRAMRALERLVPGGSVTFEEVSADDPFLVSGSLTYDRKKVEGNEEYREIQFRFRTD